jgi:DNA end-binding protein Ku
VSARAIWKGVIRVDDLALPVKLYSALEDRQVRFHLLHATDGERVKQRMVHSATGKEVPAEEVRKGFEAEPGVFVLLAEEELAGLEPESSRDIEITRFVAPEVLAHPWYRRPYYLGPDGDREGYFALAEALRRTGKEGVARWVMRKKRYLGALRPVGTHLLLVSLRHADEVISADQLEPPAGRALDPRERKMAEQLVAALEGSFEPGEFHDEYRARVLELIEAKAKGRKVPAKRAPRRPKAAPLAQALEASLRAVRKGSAGGRS